MNVVQDPKEKLLCKRKRLGMIAGKHSTVFTWRIIALPQIRNAAYAVCGVVDGAKARKNLVTQ